MSQFSDSNSRMVRERESDLWKMAIQGGNVGNLTSFPFQDPEPSIVPLVLVVAVYLLLDPLNGILVVFIYKTPSVSSYVYTEEKKSPWETH